MVHVGQFLLGPRRHDGRMRRQMGRVRRQTWMRWDQPRGREPVEVARQAARRDRKGTRVGTPEAGSRRQRVHAWRVPKQINVLPDVIDTSHTHTHCHI